MTTQAELEVARGLSEAHKAFLRATNSRKFKRYRTILRHAKLTEAKGFLKIRFMFEVSSKGEGLRLNETGLAVRRILSEGAHDHA